MAYKELLVLVDSEPQARERIALATEIAERFGAHLTALYVTETIETERRYGRPVAELLDEARGHFESVAAGQPFTSEWRTASGFPTDVAVVHARYADLTILGQLDPENDWHAVLCPRPEDVALSAGHPVLVVPYAGKLSSVGRRVLVAWDTSREATRAIGDAMPFLLAADAVTVICVDPQPSWEGHGPAAGVDLGTHLARCGVRVEIERTVSGGLDVGNLLLSRAADLGADLLVMGAYGHSRVRELVLGGTTRTVLQSMTLPTLMAH